GRRDCFCFRGLSRLYHIDPNRNAVLRFNLPDRNGAICAVEHPFNQTALCVARTISKLWHRRRKLSGKLESQSRKLPMALQTRKWCSALTHARTPLSAVAWGKA